MLPDVEQLREHRGRVASPERVAARGSPLLEFSVRVSRVEVHSPARDPLWVVHPPVLHHGCLLPTFSTMALAFSDDDEDQLPVSRKRQSLFIESSPASSDKGARRRDEDDDEGDARPAKSRRASRRQQPRFLGDDDDNDAPAGPRGRASTVPDLFADLDDLDDEPAPTAREQDASIRVDDDRRWNEDGGEREADEDGEIKIRQKRVVAKMDEERLLGPSGFPKLQASLATLKLKGKGHEVRPARPASTHKLTVS